jgi:hypothetical protein
MPSVDEDDVAVEAVSEVARHWRIRWRDAPVAHLYWEPSESRSRLYFDGDFKADVMRHVFDRVTALLADLPAGTCVVFRGHLVSSFTFGVEGR